MEERQTATKQIDAAFLERFFNRLIAMEGKHGRSCSKSCKGGLDTSREVIVNACQACSRFLLHLFSLSIRGEGEDPILVAQIPTSIWPWKTSPMIMSIFRRPRDLFRRWLKLLCATSGSMKVTFDRSDNLGTSKPLALAAEEPLQNKNAVGAAYMIGSVMWNLLRHMNARTSLQRNVLSLEDDCHLTHQSL